MRFKKSSELPGAGRTRAWHHHGSHTPTPPGAILLGKMAYPPKQIRRECFSAETSMLGMHEETHLLVYLGSLDQFFIDLQLLFALPSLQTFQRPWYLVSLPWP